MKILLEIRHPSKQLLFGLNRVKEKTTLIRGVFGKKVLLARTTRLWSTGRGRKLCVFETVGLSTLEFCSLYPAPLRGYTRRATTRDYQSLGARDLLLRPEAAELDPLIPNTPKRCHVPQTTTPQLPTKYSHLDLG
ncbi:hypothetical protein HW555_011469 [Spodoptera exigua]|uniref:Uncharacterized protein n=1 Tax=Spodoptera exigua TaxID=7107 RepID=A0A835G5B7_SPOEX|nr:hypothetical protein HW555_011469 [Spodoptera exigua]